MSKPHRSAAVLFAAAFLLATAATAFADVHAPKRGHTTKRAPERWRLWSGSAQVSKNGTSAVLWTPPPTTPDETSSALITSASTWSDQTISFTTTTLDQLRTGSDANPWEVGWVMFHFRDVRNYYWFILKTTGWELGKKQGSLTQIFLRMGDTPTVTVGLPVKVQVRVRGARIRVWVNGSEVVDYTDPNPLPAGSVGLYEEDSRVSFGSVSLGA